METEGGSAALKDAANAEKPQPHGVRKRNSEGGMDDNIAKKRMAMNAENGDALNNNLTPVNSMETAALQERVKKLERLYQRACRSARESEIRAERAEKTIASMQAEGTTDDSTSKQQAVVKQEVAVASVNQPAVDNSAEIAALQEQVKKMERMFERACRSAREAELRAERAEKIIDTKRGIKEGVDSTNQEIEQLRAKEANLRRDNEELKRGIATMTGLLEARCNNCNSVKAREAGLLQENDAIKWDLENMRRMMANGCQNCVALHARESDLRVQNEAMQFEISGLRNRIDSVKRCPSCKLLQSRVDGLTALMAKFNCENCGALKARVEYLTAKVFELNDQLSEKKLADNGVVAAIATNGLENEKNAQPPAKVADLPTTVIEQVGVQEKAKRRHRRSVRSISHMPMDEIMAGLSELSNAVRPKTLEENMADLLAGTERSTDFVDIWTPCFKSASPEDFMHIDTAAGLLKHKYEKECKKEMFLKKLRDDSVQCCGMTVTKNQLVNHFCAKKHRKQMRNADKGVSKAALALWIEAMEESRTAVETPAEAAPAAESSGGFFSWLFGSLTQPAKDPPKEGEQSRKEKQKELQIKKEPMEERESSRKENQTGLQIKKEPVHRARRSSRKENQTELQIKRELLEESEVVNRNAGGVDARGGVKEQLRVTRGRAIDTTMTNEVNDGRQGLRDELRDLIRDNEEYDRMERQNSQESDGSLHVKVEDEDLEE